MRNFKSNAIIVAGSLLFIASAFAGYGYVTPTRDQVFLQQIEAISAAEVEAGKLAAKKARSSGVRDFSEMMVSEYAWTSLDLRAMAHLKGVNIADEVNGRHGERIEQLRSLDGAAFDMAYVQSLLTNYEEAIRLCEEAERNAIDADVRALAHNVLPVLRQHLDNAQELSITARPLRTAAGMRVARDLISV